ncbi:MAG TPA: general stress protein [Acidimicrobiales bacterium]|nr:general stress protein [Acidimicrobiales bacterium]
MKHLAEFNVVATFPNMEAARKAIDALGRAGIEAEDISVLGQSVEEARSDPDTRLRDLDATADVAKKAGAGAAAGGALGALAGAAAFVIPGVGPVIGMGLLAAAAGGTVAGASVGGMVGGVAGLSLEDDWDLTFQESLREGRALVAVHATEKADVEKAAEVLEEEKADKLEWIDSEGRKLEEGQDREGGAAG